MGILDRLKKVAEGVGSVVTAPVEFTWDLANGAFTDAELDVWAEFKGELGEAFGGLFSGDSGLGAAIGAFPKPVRRAVPNAVGGVLDASEAAYGVTSRALAKGVAQRATRVSGDLPGVYLDTRESLERADELAKGRSPGEVAALGVSTDVWSDEAIENRENSWGFHVASGTIDAVLRLSPLDPLNKVGFAAKAARVRFVDTPVAKVGIEQAMDSRRVNRFLDAITDKNASEIRDQFFSSHAHGAQIASLLADGERGVKANTLRALMGDGESLAALQAERADIAHQLSNLMGESAHKWGDDTLFSNADHIARVEAEMEALYPQADRLDMMLDLSGAVQTVPRYSRVGEVRSSIGRSVTYQKSPLTRPLRVVSNKMPHHWVNLNDQRSDVQVWRQVRDSYLPVEEQDRLRAAAQAAPNPAARQKAIGDADEAAVRSILDKYDVPRGDVETLMNDFRRSRDTAMGALRNRRYDADGRGKVSWTDIDGTEVELHLPLYVTQQAELLPLSDLKAIESAAKAVAGNKYKQFRLNNRFTDIPAEGLEAFYAVWRPSALLRFGWPQRILLDEQLRIMSEIGVLATMAKWPRGVKTMADRAGSAVARKVAKNSDVVSLEAVDARAVGRLNKPVEAQGETFESPFGDPGVPANVFFKEVSARGTFRQIVEGEKAQLLEGLREHTGHFGTIHPNHKDYEAMWGWAVNKHIRQDALAMEMLNGRSVDDAVRWLMGGTPEAEPPVPPGMMRLYRGVSGDTPRRHMTDEQLEQVGRWFTPDRAVAEFYGDPDRPLLYVDVPEATAREWATNDWSRPFRPGDNIFRQAPEALVPREVADAAGRLGGADTSGPAYARRMGWKPHTFRSHVEDIDDQIGRYLPGDLRALAAERDLSSAELKNLVPDEALPAVHGEELLQAFGKSPLLDRVREVRDKAFNALGTIPTDVLSRQPYFAHVYQREIDRLAELFTVQARTARPVFDDVMEIVEDAVPGKPAVRIPGAPVEPAAPGLPPLFHGTSDDLGDRLLDRYQGGRSADNLFGPGFYTTESRQTAESYTAKGGRTNPTVYGVKWTGENAPRFLDLDGPAPQELQDAIRRQWEYTLEDAPEGSYLEDLLTGQRTGTGSEWVRALRRHFSEIGIATFDADEIMHDVADDLLAAGWDGLTHIGGGSRYAGSGNAEHVVRIFFEPERLSVSRVSEKVVPGDPGSPAVTQTRKVQRAPLTLDDETKKRIEQQARRTAVNDTQALLYDLAERNELTHILRFMAPFYSAWQEVGVTWARQTWKNPEFTARARYAWSAPERAGLVRDENGNVVDANGGAENPLTGERVKAGSERYVTLPFDVPGLPTKGSVSFNKKSMNLVLTGSPGVGPVPQVLVNEIVKDRPDLAESLEWVLPFGSTQETMSLLLPATAKRFNQRMAGEEDRVYRNTLVRMMYDRQVEFRAENGRYPNAREREKLYKDVKADTDRLFNVRMVASYVLPFAPIFDSPYKPYIDTYRQMAERVRADPRAVGGRSMLIADEHGNPRSVDEWFYDEYGPEYLPLAQSLSSSRDGVIPTIEAWQARNKYKDLIEKHPELGGFIVGSEGAGEFNRSVYDMQLSTPVKPGSSVKQRETPGFDEAFTKPEIAEGWLKYTRAMDLIDAARVARGLPSLNVKAASDLAAAKRAATAAIADQFPEWWAEYNKNDQLAFKRRLAGLREIAADKRFAGRQDVQGLRDYLHARGLVLDTLRKRAQAGGAKTLTAAANQDLAIVWDAVTASLVERNLAFADVYYRWLERDPMED